MLRGTLVVSFLLVPKFAPLVKDMIVMLGTLENDMQLYLHVETTLFLTIKIY